MDSVSFRATPRSLIQNVITKAKVPYDGARLFQNFCFLTPLLWALGILTISTVLMVMKMVAERWPRGLAINLIVASWLGIAIVQIGTSLLHGVAVGNFFGELRNLTSFAIVGWVFGALIIAMGSAHCLANERTIRAITWLGLYMLVLSTIALPFRFLGFSSLTFPTPLGMILPPSPAIRFYTSASFFWSEDTFGEKTARFILFFPWFTALGLGALSVVFISTLDKNWKWRLTGIIGGSIATVLSWSRMAIFCLVIFGALQFYLRLPRLVQIVCISVAILALYVALLNGFDPVADYDYFQSSLTATRPGSNLARDLIYEKSWEGFLQSPYFGNGLNFPPAHKTEPIAIGSHSTIYGLLYTAGAPGLAAFVFTMLVTFACLIQRYLTETNGEERQRIVIGISLALSLVLYCKFEALYSLTIPCFVLFAWIGACFPSQFLSSVAGISRVFVSFTPQRPPNDVQSLASVAVISPESDRALQTTSKNPAFERALSATATRKGGCHLPCDEHRTE